MLYRVHIALKVLLVEACQKDEQKKGSGPKLLLVRLPVELVHRHEHDIGRLKPIEEPISHISTQSRQRIAVSIGPAGAGAGVGEAHQVFHRFIMRLQRPIRTI